METLEGWTWWAFMKSVGSYPGMEKIVPALINPNVFSGVLLRKVGTQPAFYFVILNVLAGNTIVPFCEYLIGLYMVYSLFYNLAFYNLVFEGIYDTIWTMPLPDTVTTLIPGYDDFKENL